MDCDETAEQVLFAPKIIGKPNPNRCLAAQFDGSELICITGSFFLATDMAGVMRKAADLNWSLGLWRLNF
jgi:hypothetical protein